MHLLNSISLCKNREILFMDDLIQASANDKRGTIFIDWSSWGEKKHIKNQDIQSQAINLKII